MLETTGKYSVLMSVYYKEKPENLLMAMESIWNQSVATDDFVLVCDGSLTPGLDRVIEEMQAKHPELHTIRLAKNNGLGKALNQGITMCKHELVARMDSDDISRNDRIERQLRVFSSDSRISICSGTVEEFSESIERIDARRMLPQDHQLIEEFAKKRNPFNHPCVMYKKSAVEEAGGYLDFYLLEDYYLWIRMLQNGAKGYNIQEPLLYMRAGSDMYKRRAGWKYAKSQKNLFKYMRKIGFIDSRQYLRSVCSRTIASLVPNWLRKKMFVSLARK